MPNRFHVWRICSFVFYSSSTLLGGKEKWLNQSWCNSIFPYCSLSNVEGAASVSENHTHERNTTDTLKKKKERRTNENGASVCVFVVAYSLLIAIVTVKKITHQRELRALYSTKLSVFFFPSLSTYPNLVQQQEQHTAIHNNITPEGRPTTTTHSRQR